MSWSTIKSDGDLAKEIESHKSLCELRDDYHRQIEKIEARIRDLRNDYSAPNRGERINNLRNAIANLQFGLKGIYSNIRAKEQAIKRLEAEKSDSHHDNETWH